MREFPFDDSRDFLADAALTPEQRAYWLQFRAAYSKLRARVAEYQAKAQDEQDTGGMVLSQPEFHREVARLLALENRYGGTSSVVILNCENLHEVTTTYGRNVTNAAIRNLCDVLLANVRACDIVGRLGVTEFAVLLVRCSNDDAWRKAESLAQIMQDAVREVHQHNLSLSISFGAYSFAPRDDVTAGLGQAAKAMTAKAKA
jgi:diguanylate cyclase (GGDEF)-like protein